MKYIQLSRTFVDQTAALVAISAAVILGGAATVTGQTITVTTVDDIVDFASPQQVAQLPGPDGKVSFREAVVAANNTSGPQTIAFAIPQNEWWLFNDMALLRQENGIFNLTANDTTVDFTTQTLFTGDTNPNGSEVGIYGLEPNAWGIAAIYINGSNCIIKGLGYVGQRGYGVRIQGHNNRVIACTISGPLYAAVYITNLVPNSPATGNIVGGTGPGEGNVLSAGNSGVRIDGPAQNNIVIGNTLSGSFYGAEIRTATCCAGYVASNNRIGGPTLAERNIIAGAGKYGEEGFPVGGQVAVEYSPNNIVEGNYIGVLADGMTVPTSQRGPVGIEVRTSPGTIVRNNLIAGILVIGTNHYAGQRFGDAIRVMGDCVGSVIQGNQIGVGSDGTTAIPCRAGIVASYWSIDGSQVNPGPITIGGVSEGSPNVVANSETTGVRVNGQIKRVTISANSIFANAGLGIDLLTQSGTTGITPNDVGDGDVGGNDLQNFPVIAAAESDGSTTHLQGTLNSTPNSQFTLEFFWNQVCDPSGHGEGEHFIGATVVNTDASGHAAFDEMMPQPSPPGSFVTATARSSLGNTSEFSACQQVTESEVRVADINSDGVVDANDLLLVINNWGACPSNRTCPADIAPIGGDLMVNVNDLLAVINDWG